MTDTTTREQELLEEFKAGLDPDAAPQLAQRIAALEADRDRASDAAGTVQRERDDAVTAKEAAEKERDEAIARADAADKATKAAKSKLERSTSPAKPRKLGEMNDGLTGEDLDDALAEAAADEKSIEIAFSDGSKELIGIPPVSVQGDVWRPHALGKMLRDPVAIDGPVAGSGRAGFQIVGYALLIDGKQVAYTRRSDPVNVGPGQKITLADDIYF
jgi:hypothetical protein